MSVILNGIPPWFGSNHGDKVNHLVVNFQLRYLFRPSKASCTNYALYHSNINACKHKNKNINAKQITCSSILLSEDTGFPYRPPLTSKACYWKDSMFAPLILKPHIERKISAGFPLSFSGVHLISSMTFVIHAGKASHR